VGKHLPISLRPFLPTIRVALCKGSGYRTTCGSLNLKRYSTAFCNMTATHDESAVGLLEMTLH